MFYGREDDLRALDRLWRKPVASFVTCRGRRRIGKSTLIEEFARRSRARFLEIEGLPPQPNQTNDDQLNHFAEQLREQSDWRGVRLESWYEAMLALSKAAEQVYSIPTKEGASVFERATAAALGGKWTGGEKNHKCDVETDTMRIECKGQQGLVQVDEVHKREDD